MKQTAHRPVRQTTQRHAQPAYLASSAVLEPARTSSPALRVPATLPVHATTAVQRQHNLVGMHAVVGNQRVQRMLAQRCSCGRPVSGAGECPECRAAHQSDNQPETTLLQASRAAEQIQRVSWEGAASETACALLSDQQIYYLFRDVYFSSQPNARQHLVHYRTGGGAPYTENVSSLFSANPRVRSRIARLISQQIAAGTTTRGSLIGRGVDDGGEPPIRQSDYDSEDWRNANGNIDQVDWEAVGSYNPRGYNQVRITVSDPYTWHPQEGRPTQCLHAAFERLKTQGAADYVTTGSATILLPPIAQSPDLPIESVL